MNKPLTYPVGEQDFAKIRNDGRVYVDKTAIIYRLANEGGFYFLSRPRRFGKSLMLSTLKYYFEGRRELFKGLAIDQLESDWKQHPVFLFDMSRDKHMDEHALRMMLDWMLCEYERKYHVVPPSGDTFANRVSRLIVAAHEQTGLPAVVLIDEYDAPLLDGSGDESLLTTLRNIMRGFYSPLKAMSAHLRFVMLTGITKFSQLSIFSELNNLTNISMMPQYDSICGITQEELDSQLRKSVECFAQNEGVTIDEATMMLKQYYDGYHFTEKSVDIYTPFSLIKALQYSRIDSYWFESGTPTWLLEQMRRFDTELSDMEQIEVPADQFDRPTESLTSITPLLYQSGYLTIKDYDRESNIFTLSIPNKEVRSGLGSALSYALARNEQSLTNRAYLQKAYFKLQREGDIDNFMEKLDAFYRSIPYDISNDNERHFQAILYATIAGFGADIMAEDRTSDGRSDIVIRMANDIYVVEMKYGQSVDAAMEQLHKKDYAAKWREDGRPVHLLGINIDKATRGVEAWRLE